MTEFDRLKKFKEYICKWHYLYVDIENKSTVHTYSAVTCLRTTKNLFVTRVLIIECASALFESTGVPLFQENSYHVSQPAREPGMVVITSFSPC